jgi:hypothetical protein
MDVVSKARPDKVEEFSIQCRDFGECDMSELEAKASVYHGFLQSTYGTAVMNEVVPKMVLLLPEFEQRRVMLVQCGLLAPDPIGEEEDPLFADSGTSASWRRTAIRF